ncbi:MAG: CpXC domain-containing protein [Chloroflexota bacterium]
MPKTQVSCPNCRQPLVADVNQLFDTNVDPQAKSRLLSGAYNLVQCQFCGYQGNLSTPIVYHDPEKELLLTFVPPEMNLPRNEQERLIGGLINQVIAKLSQEKRKGYLLNPQATLTMQGLIERVLEKDGITREMLQAQQQRMALLQRLANASDDAVLEQIAQQEDAIIDAEFFTLLNRLVEISMMNNDRESAQRLADVQRALLPVTTYGRQLQAQSQEIETAMNDLRALGNELDHNKLIDLVLNAPNEIRLSALVSFARPAMDYTFFTQLSQRIEQAQGDDKTRLNELRGKLLQMTQEIDRQMEAHRQEVRQVIEAIAGSKSPAQAMSQVLNQIDDAFVQELQLMLGEARQKGDLEKSAKYQEMITVLQQASTPPEMELIEQFLEAEDDAARQQFLEAHQDEITPEFVELLANINMQMQQQPDDPEFAERIAAANRQALRFNMLRSMRG